MVNLKQITKIFLPVFVVAIIVCVTLLLLLTEMTSGGSLSNDFPWESDNRIPNTTYADHYDLYLHPDLETKTFSGKVNIRITCSHQQDYLLVHSRNLTIDPQTLKLVNVTDDLQQQTIGVLESFHYEPNEFYVIRTPMLSPGVYELSLEFNGSLAGKIVGFYYSEYATDNRGVIPLATSKFQPTFARQAFPCFDEPSFRSTYTLTLVRPSGRGYSGLSNMPIRAEKLDSPSNGLTEVLFEKSVSMVSYLVCFIVSDFVYSQVEIEGLNGRTLPFRVYSPKEKLPDLEYALQFGSSTLAFYEKMFDYGFPLPKCDMAAIPDYSSGATEHWGLVTYRETNLLYNVNVSSTQNLQRVASVIAHEMAHQWFGNLVTLQWWNDLWLNEGFASYIQGKGVDKHHPDWNMNSQFVVDVLQGVLDYDSKLSSHPIVKTVQTPEQINAMFDTISYNKGSSVLRMLEGFMGTPSFQNGVNNFIKKFAYKNAVTQDLYDELTLAWSTVVPSDSKSDVGDIMKTWTDQMGYPVLTVNRTGSSTLVFTQTRFLKDPKATYSNSDSPFGYKWDVPISMVTSEDAANERKLWLYRENNEVTVTIDEKVSWLKVNHNQSGYYRVNYSPDIWHDLMENFQFLTENQVLSPEDRSSLYDDAFALADAALLSYDLALDLTRSLTSEGHYVPWKSASSRLVHMEYLLLSTGVVEGFKSYVNSLVNSLYSSLQWLDSGSHLERLLRVVIVNLSSFSGLSSSLEEAGRLLQSWIDDEAVKLPLDTRRQIYWWGMVNSGSNENWEVMWSRCLKELNSAQKSNLYYGLANSQDPRTLNRYINLTFDVNNTKMQDFLNILKYISLNPVGMNVAWDWVRSNWGALEDRYGADDRYLGGMVPYITQYFTTEEKLHQVEDFYNTVASSGIVQQYKNQTIETIEGNVYWVQTYSPVIQDWLKNQGFGS